MKTKLLIFSLASLLLTIGAVAQNTSNLEVFSKDGEAFFLTVNGIKQNDEARSNVQAIGLKGEFHRVTVEFADKTLGIISQNFNIEPGFELRATVMLRKNGQYTIRPFGEPVALSNTRQTAEPTARMTPTESITEPVQAPTEEMVIEAPLTKVTTTTTTTTSGGGSGRETIRMDVGMGDQRIGLNVEINDPTFNESTTTIQTTEQVVVREEVRRAPPAPAAAREEVVVRCAPMESSAFAGAKRSISSKSFADEKKTTARQVLRSNCMSTDQIVEVIGLFSFEDDKLEFAKSAYDRCSDPENYWKVNDAFTFSDSIEQLDEFIQQK